MGETTPDASVTTCNTARERLLALSGGKMTYRAVAALVGLSAGMVWKIIEQNYEPKDPLIRQRLGLDLCLTRDTEVHGVRVCKCGKSFVPNSPLRTRCFTCSPYQPGERR